jgi:gliding motility-associated-like protein
LPSATIAGTATVCQNATGPTITFTGSGGTAPYTFTYSINGGSNQTISTTVGNTVTLAAATTTSGAFTYALVSVQDGSISACSNPVNGNAVVTVSPSVKGSISGSIEVCQNATAPDITFTGANGTTPYTFTYTFNNGANQTISTTAGNAVTLPVATTATGLFNYTLVNIQDAGSTSCYAAAGTATVTVNPLPTASISGATSVCQNGPSPTITFTGASGKAPYTFAYTINNGPNQTVSTSVGNMVTVPVPTSVSGPFTYSLVSVQDGSLSVCSQLQSGAALVTIIPLPTASISGTVAVCNNSPSPDITFTGANGTAPYTFTYTVNGGAAQTISTTAGNSVTLPVSTTIPGPFVYALVSVKDAGGATCSNVATGTATVTVNPLPTASISGPPSVCQNSPASIIFTGGSGVAPYTFTYTVNNGTPQTITSISGNTVTLPAATNISGPQVYSVVGVQDASAATCSNVVSGSAVVTITVNPLPTATVGVSTSVCINDPSPFITFTGANGTPPYTFIYTINGAAPQSISTLAGNSIAVSVPTNTVGTYTYAMVSLHDASAVTCVNNANSSAVVTVNPQPSANFSVHPETASTIDPTISITDASAGAILWTWDFGDFDTSFVPKPYAHSYADTGNYIIKLMISSQFGCKDSISHIIRIEVPYLFFIPNAFSPNEDGKNEYFTVKGEGIVEFEMMIFDRWGNFIFYSDDVDKGWDGKASLGSETAQSDVYVYAIKILDLKGKSHSYKGTVTIVK